MKQLTSLFGGLLMAVSGVAQITEITQINVAYNYSSNPAQCLFQALGSGLTDSRFKQNQGTSFNQNQLVANVSQYEHKGFHLFTSLGIGLGEYTGSSTWNDKYLLPDRVHEKISFTSYYADMGMSKYSNLISNKLFLTSAFAFVANYQSGKAVYHSDFYFIHPYSEMNYACSFGMDFHLGVQYMITPAWGIGISANRLLSCRWEYTLGSGTYDEWKPAMGGNLPYVYPFTRCLPTLNLCFRFPQNKSKKL